MTRYNRSRIRLQRRKKSHQVNVRLSDRGREVLIELAHHTGMTYTSLFEYLLREEGRRIRILPQPEPI
jgi:hypothetical protein